ncbi:MAG: hypothetical protein LBR73_09675 [Oscillospiraceae bacterium]|nr:hypothetical protein [Oscillospiraceae bacterium]
MSAAETVTETIPATETEIVTETRSAPKPKVPHHIHLLRLLFGVSVVGSLLLSLALLMNSASHVGVLGLHLYTEVTDAMSPDIPAGSLLITVRKKVDKIQPGDIITFATAAGKEDSRLTRVVADKVSLSGGSAVNVAFLTKTPKSTSFDAIQPNYTNILGVKLLSIPGAAWILLYIRNYSWVAALLTAGACISIVAVRRKQALAGENV